MRLPGFFTEESGPPLRASNIDSEQLPEAESWLALGTGTRPDRPAALLAVDLRFSEADAAWSCAHEALEAAG